MQETLNYETADFETDVLKRSHDVPVLVDFWAAWCGPCRVLGPTLERLASDADGRWVLAKVDTDAHEEIAARYGIRSIPAVKLFVDGKVTDEFMGALPEASVRQWLQKALPDPNRSELSRAEQLIHGGSPAAARTLLEKILLGTPDHEQAKVLLAQTLWSGDHRKAAQIVSGIEEHSEHFALADAIRTVSSLLDRLPDPAAFAQAPVHDTYTGAIRSIAEEDYDRALEQFISVIRTDRYYDEDGARKACIALFRLLGEEHPTTKQYRREFSSALY